MKVCVLKGVEGASLIVDGTRIVGSKPWGGGEILHEWELNKRQVNALQSILHEATFCDQPPQEPRKE